MMAMKVILAAVVRRFHFESGYKNLEELLENVQIEMTLKDMRNFPLKWTIRGN